MLVKDRGEGAEAGREMPVKIDSREERQAGTAQTKVQLWHLSQSNMETRSK